MMHLVKDGDTYIMLILSTLTTGRSVKVPITIHDVAQVATRTLLWETKLKP